MNSESNSLITAFTNQACQINRKTATPIDKFFVNGQAQKYNSGNIITSSYNI